MNLRQLREQRRDPETGRKLSGEKIAQQLGVSTMTYYSWEKGINLPGGENLFKLEKLMPGSINALKKMWEERRRGVVTKPKPGVMDEAVA